MEQYHWIKAYYASQNDDSEREILVRQEVEGSEMFVDEKDNRYHISELDLTQSGGELIPVDKSDGLKWLLQSMDANAIADHKAKIDEREYWRKLRGDIFMSMLEGNGTPEQCLEMTEIYFSRLYDQDQEFFKDK